MAKSYFANKNAGQENGEQVSTQFPDRRKNGFQRRILQFSNRCQMLDERAVWQAALQAETAKAG